MIVRTAKDKIDSTNDKKPLKPQIFSYDKMMKMTVLYVLSHCFQRLQKILREQRASIRKKGGGSVTRTVCMVVCCSDGNKLQGFGNKVHRPAQS